MRKNTSSVPALQLISICAQYRKDEPVFSELNISISAGSRILLAGGDGTGKTTLLSILSGHLKPVSGRFLIQGKHFAPESKADIGYVPDVFAFKTTLCADDIIEIYDRFFSNFDREKLLLRLAELNIPKDKGFHSLTPAERQAVQFAFTSARACSIYLLDNPLNLLTEEEQTSTLQAFFQNIPKEATVIYVGDVYPALDELLTEIICLGNGKIQLYESLSYLKSRYGKETWEILQSLSDGGLN